MRAEPFPVESSPPAKKAGAVPFASEYVTLSKQAHIELVMQAHSFKSLHERAVARAAWRQERYQRVLRQLKEQGAQREAALRAELEAAQARIRDLEQRLFGGKSERHPRVRHRLEKHKLAEQLFKTINDLLRQRGLMLRAGTLVDATLIAAHSSTKNKAGQRDPEMHSSKKGEQWHFGMKAHIGVDVEFSLVHTVRGTAGNVADVSEGNQLLHGHESVGFGDAGYQGIDKRQCGRSIGRMPIFWQASRHAPDMSLRL